MALHPALCLSLPGPRQRWAQHSTPLSLVSSLPGGNQISGCEDPNARGPLVGARSS